MSILANTGFGDMSNMNITLPVPQSLSMDTIMPSKDQHECANSLILGEILEDGETFRKIYKDKIITKWSNKPIGPNPRSAVEIPLAKPSWVYSKIYNFRCHEIIAIQYIPNCPEGITGKTHFLLKDDNVVGMKSILHHIEVPIDQGSFILFRSAYSLRIDQKDMKMVCWADSSEYDNTIAPGSVRYGVHTDYANSPSHFHAVSPIKQNIERMALPNYHDAMKALVFDSETNKKFDAIARPSLYLPSDARKASQSQRITTDYSKLIEETKATDRNPLRSNSMERF